LNLALIELVAQHVLLTDRSASLLMECFSQRMLNL